MTIDSRAFYDVLRYLGGPLPKMPRKLKKHLYGTRRQRRRSDAAFQRMRHNMRPLHLDIVVERINLEVRSV